MKNNVTNAVLSIAAGIAAGAIVLVFPAAVLAVPAATIAYFTAYYYLENR